MARIVEERWVCNEESKRILDDYAAKIEEEKRQAKKEALSRANISHMSEYNELLLKYLRLKDFLRDCYPEVWKEFGDETETKMS